MQTKTKNILVFIAVFFLASLGSFFYKPYTKALEADQNLTPWLEKYFGSSCDPGICGQGIDADSDGLNNLQEYNLSTDPNNPDSDQDGLADGDEINIFNSDPLKFSTAQNTVYSDGNFITGGFILAAGAVKMDEGQVAQISQKILEFGLHKPTPTTLGYALSLVYKLNLPKKIQVSLKNQELDYYLGDYMIGSFKISSGTKNRATPPGDYEILQKKPTVTYKGLGYNYPNTKWNLLFKKQSGGSLYIHGAYWHNNFGQPMSHGCINVAYDNMEKLYNWAEVGTEVKIE